MLFVGLVVAVLTGRVPAREPAAVKTEPAAPVAVVKASPALAAVRAAIRHSRHPWRAEELPALAEHFEQAGARTGIDPVALIALVLVESHFTPTVIHRNRNGTADYGLTQQNSYYVQTRCLREIGRRCTQGELVLPAVQVRLMTRTLTECGRAFRTTDQRLVCYHSWAQAAHFRRTGARPLYLRKIDQARRFLTV